MKTDAKKEYLEIMIRKFEDLKKQYPQGGFDDVLINLKQNLVNYTSRIGQKPRQ